MLIFIGLYIVFSLAANLIRAIFRFPVLKQLDGLTGGVFGLLRGVLICLAVFTLIPLVQTMIPLEFITQLLEESQLAPLLRYAEGSLGSFLIYLSKSFTALSNC